MINLIRCEIKKFFKSKIIISSLIVLIIFLLCCVYIDNSNISTVFDMEYFSVVNFGKFLIIPFFVTLVSYTYSIEIDCGTLKILRSKNIKPWKVYIAKFITSSIYVFIVLFIIYVAPYLNTSKYSIDVMKFNIAGGPINDISTSFKFVTVLYLRQFCAYMFVVALVLFLAIVTQNKIIPIVGEIIFTLVSTTLSGSSESRFEFISTILPLSSENIYSEYISGTVNERLVCLIIYTIILIIISIIIYWKKEIKF